MRRRDLVVLGDPSRESNAIKVYNTNFKSSRGFPVFTNQRSCSYISKASPPAGARFSGFQHYYINSYTKKYVETALTILLHEFNSRVHEKECSSTREKVAQLLGFLFYFTENVLFNNFYNAALIDYTVLRNLWKGEKKKFAQSEHTCGPGSPRSPFDPAWPARPCKRNSRGVITRN